MLTNIDWIAEGKPFPPVEEEERLKRYKDEEHMFNGEYTFVYGSYFAELQNNLRMRDANVQTILNYPQLLSKKTADFICSEPPEINTGENTDVINDTLDNMAFNNTLYEAMMDISRFGNSVIKILDNRISIVPPEYWFPIVDPYDAKHVTTQVLAFVSGNEIYVEIHNNGYYERRYYEVKKQKGNKNALEFGKLLNRETIITGIGENAVQVLTNVTNSKSIYGISDYNIIKGVHKQLLWRIFCVERILDKHAAPSLVGSNTMLQQDPVTGMYLFKAGNFFERNSNDDVMPQYLTWDGNLNAVQWEIEWLTNQLYTLSEMGAAFLEGAGKGEVNSGRALKLRMTSPLIKAQRLIGINEQAIKLIITIMSVATGQAVQLKDISITWNDGLPNDTIELCEIYEKATGGKAFMSQFAAVKSFNGLDDAKTDEELAMIEGEHTSVIASHGAFENINDNGTVEEGV